jgi:hypothetical protein
MEAQTLLQEIDSFLASDGKGLSETAFGIKAVNDGKFIPSLRDGRRIWPETAERVRKFMDEARAATSPKKGSGPKRASVAA